MGSFYNRDNFCISNLTEIIKNEIIYGAHITALASSGLVITIYIMLDIKIDIIALIVPYLIAYIIYTFNYYSELEIDIKTNPKKVKYLIRRKKYYSITMVATISLLIFLLIVLQNIGFLSFVMIIITGGILYTLVFKVLTKSILGFKSIYTSLVAIYAAVFFVLFYYSINFSLFFLIIFLFMFIKMLINVIFFDIKDYHADKFMNLKTFPVILGINKTTLLLHSFNILSLAILFYGIYIHALPFYASILGVFFFYTLFYVNKGNTTNNTELLNYTYVMADAEFIFWPIVLAICKIFIN